MDLKDSRRKVVNNNKQLKLTIFFILTLSACETTNYGWYKEGATQEDFSKTKYLCLLQSHLFINDTNEVKDNAFTEASRNPANRNESNVLLGFGAGLEASRRNRTQGYFFDACMNSEGWYLKQMHSQ
jgi:hypothetical protein